MEKDVVDDSRRLRIIYHVSAVVMIQDNCCAATGAIWSLQPARYIGIYFLMGVVGQLEWVVSLGG